MHMVWSQGIVGSENLAIANRVGQIENPEIWNLKIGRFSSVG
jgi:hypothetical protein